MSIELSPTAEKLLNEQMASGSFSSPSDLVEQALRFYGFHLTDDESLAALKKSVAEMEAGKTVPAEQVFEEIRNKHGWAK
jgi:predicted transcriptional regulator